MLTNFQQNLQAIKIDQADIQNDQVGSYRLHLMQKVGAGRRCENVISFVGEFDGIQFPDVFLIVDYKDSCDAQFLMGYERSYAIYGQD